MHNDLKMSYLQNFKYELSGSENSPKLVFLHGLMGAAVNWRKISLAFQKNFHILTFDQRGHGQSFKPPLAADGRGYTPEDYATDLKMILDELGWGKIILVGHSMGGRNALNFTEMFPDRVQALVVEDIGPEGQRASMDKTLARIEMVPTPFASKPAARDYFNTTFIEANGGGETARIIGQFFYMNIEQLPDGRADWRFQKEAILSSLREGHFRASWDVVRGLRCPTLFVRGQHSQDFTHEEFEKTLQSNKNIQGVEIAEAGHWVHFDQPEAFIRVLKDFFTSLGF